MAFKLKRLLIELFLFNWILRKDKNSFSFCATCRHRFGRIQTHEVPSPLCLGVIARANLEYIKTYTYIEKDPPVDDPIQPGIKVTTYTTVNNGVLLSSWQKGSVGHYSHAVVGRGHHDSDYVPEGRQGSYFK